MQVNKDELRKPIVGIRVVRRHVHEILEQAGAGTRGMKEGLPGFPGLLCILVVVVRKVHPTAHCQ